MSINNVYNIVSKSWNVKNNVNNNVNNSFFFSMFLCPFLFVCFGVGVFNFWCECVQCLRGGVRFPNEVGVW